MKAKLRILLTLAYLLALAGHGLEHRFAKTDVPVASESGCDACAFLTYAGHAIGSGGASPAPVIHLVSTTPASAAPVVSFVPTASQSGPLGARAPPAFT